MTRPSAARILLFFGALLAQSCITARREPLEINGMASWYGQEFAGRTTANGEIFDPLQLTAAHRSLPFGTILEVKNPQTGKSVQVRVNDRGPFVGNRILDLSFGAAERIGMVKTGVSAVEIRVLKVGAGEREPPKPYIVKIGQAKPIAIEPPPPPIAFPLPEETRRAEVRSEPIVESVQVIEERAPVVTAPSPPVVQEQRAPAPEPRSAAREGFVLQLGAFQLEKNALQLRDKIAPILPAVFMEKVGDLFRIRAGPYITKVEAIEVRERLSAAGFESILLAAR